MSSALRAVSALFGAMSAAICFAAGNSPAATNLTGTITAVCQGEFVLNGTLGKIWIDSVTNKSWSLGDTVSVSGTPIENPRLKPKTIPAFEATEIKILSHGLVTPKAITPARLASGTFDYEQVSVSGVVTDAFRDEIDPDFIFLIIEAGGAKAISTFRDAGTVEAKRLESLIDTAVSATGMCVTHYMDGRHNMDRFLWLTGIDAIQHMEDSPDKGVHRDFPHRKPRRCASCSFPQWRSHRQCRR